jgi:septum formation protein
LAGLQFEARSAFIDETAVKHAARACMAQPGETALELARRKARLVASPGEMVIGCDQLLVCGEHWYDKPVDMHAARRQLQALRGQTHVLETACVVLHNGLEVFDHLARPRLSMRAFSDAFLDAYLAAEGEIVLSSVGAYRLEGLGIQLFDTIDGDHSAILGLPLLPLLGFLRANGMIMD